MEPIRTKNADGTDGGATYYVGPSGQLCVIKDINVQKHKAAAGWRFATQADIDAKTGSAPQPAEEAPTQPATE